MKKQNRREFLRPMAASTAMLMAAGSVCPCALGASKKAEQSEIRGKLVNAYYLRAEMYTMV